MTFGRHGRTQAGCRGFHIVQYFERSRIAFLQGENRRDDLRIHLLPRKPNKKCRAAARLALGLNRATMLLDNATAN